jgi:phenylpyruvate tautomerase PptA (4-oxalocrotonate tautomerase family)
MTQVKIYGLRGSLAARKAALSDAIHAALMASFGLPSEKRFQRFILLERDEFIFPADRSDNYTILEISMFEGRSLEAKRQLIMRLFSAIAEQVGITPHDLEITLVETPRANWGIRGQPGDELALNYKVDV